MLRAASPRPRTIVGLGAMRDDGGALPGPGVCLKFGNAWARSVAKAWPKVRSMQFCNLGASRKSINRRDFPARKNPCMRAFGAAMLLLTIPAVVPAGAQPAPQAAVPVGTVYAARQPISNIRDFVGRVQATDRVEVRARVQGYLEQVLFKEGEIVRKSDQLYQIEKGLFQAAVEAAKGALERSKAAKTLTEIQLQRAEGLLEKK